MSDSQQRTAIVTGAAGGIGAGVAEALAERGDNVVLADLNEAGLRTLHDRIVASGGRSLPVTMDTTSTEDSRRTVEVARSEFGGLDILVVAAGGHAGAKPTDEIPDEEWEAGISANLTGGFKIARAAIPVMKEAHYGRVVFVSSASGRTVSPTTPTVGHYAAAKAGLIGLARQLAVELGPFGITVNCVAPGTTLTPRVRRIRSDESLARIAQSVPLGRVAEVDDQVEPILFLTSDAARYITGVTLDVNGGRVMV